MIYPPVEGEGGALVLLLNRSHSAVGKTARDIYLSLLPGSERVVILAVVTPTKQIVKKTVSYRVLLVFSGWTRLRKNPHTCALVGTKFPSISYRLDVLVRSVSVCVTFTQARAAALSRGDAALSIHRAFLGAPEPRIALVSRPPIGTSPVWSVRVS